MRFIRLDSDKQDYLVYATRMVGDLTIILVFGPSSPLSQIRPQTKSLAQSMAALPPRQETSEQAQSQRPTFPAAADQPESDPLLSQSGSSMNPEYHQTEEPGPFSSQDKFAENTSGDFPDEAISSPVQPDSASASTGDFIEQPLDDFDIISRVQSGFTPSNGSQLADETSNLPMDEEAAFDIPVPDLKAVLGPIPTPDPDLPEDETDVNLPISTEKEKSTPAAAVTQTMRTAGHASPQSSMQAGSDLQDAAGMAVDDPRTAEIKQALHEMFPEPDIDPLEDTRPHIVSAITSLGQLEPVSPAMSQLKYTCILIPRMPNHFLTGSLADLVGQWIQQVCLAYGWRLEAISIRPEYLQWTVQVAPSISPGNVVRIIRQRSSYQIFNKNLQYRDENPSGDFWAAGYLIVSGAQPPSSQLLREYIDQTRRRQGSDFLVIRQNARPELKPARLPFFNGALGVGMSHRDRFLNMDNH